LEDEMSRESKVESTQAIGERIIGDELKRRRWSEQDLKQRPKSDAAKLKLAARLRWETTLTIRQIDQMPTP